MIIGVSGKKGSGKDVIADYLVKEYDFKKISFADPIKEALKIIFGWDNSHLYTNKKNEIDKEFGISPRVAMQTLGTDWGQFSLMERGENFCEIIGRKLWVYSVFKAIEKYGYEDAVIPDVRFLHEAEEIKKRNGYIIKVERDLNYNEDKHLSETEMDEINPDTTIFNDANIEMLYTMVDTYIELIKYPKKVITPHI